MARANSIRPTEATTAAIITPTWLTCATAVMIESSEKTRSMTMICAITPAKLDATLRRPAASPPSEQPVHSASTLPDQEQATGDQG